MNPTKTGILMNEDWLAIKTIEFKEQEISMSFFMKVLLLLACTSTIPPSAHQGIGRQEKITWYYVSVGIKN